MNACLLKLSADDKVALEAKYHANCLTHLYNRRRTLAQQTYKQCSSHNYDCYESIAFAELTAYINDLHAIEGLIPVFKLVDLKNTYCNRLQQLNPTAVNQVNSTR